MAGLTDDVIVNDMSFRALGLVLKHFEDVPPEVKTEIIDIPFGENMDVTDAFGDVAFTDRTHKFEWLVLNVTGGRDGFMRFVSSLFAKLHGKRTTYTLSFDPDYTYVGRWSIKSYEWYGNGFGAVSMEVDTAPWKLKGIVSDTFCAYPRTVRKYANGQKPARPIVTALVDTKVISNGNSMIFKPGTHTSSGFTLKMGENTVEFNAVSDFDWSVGEDGVLYASDELISYDESTQTVTIADELVELFTDVVLVLNDSAPIVNVKYDWKDL